MLSSAEFIQYSLELNLFFARIMKEHSFFIEGGFTPRDSNLAQQADGFKLQFEALLADTIALSDGIISPDVAMSGEIVTQYTFEAECASQFYTGVSLNSRLTQAEAGLGATPDFAPASVPELEQQVLELNDRAIALTSALIDFKDTLLNAVLSCRLFTVNFPLLIDHITREARLYRCMLAGFQNHERMDSPRDFLEQQIFWNRIMNEHALFIRGLLDPTEQELITNANNFGNEFNLLTQESAAAMDRTIPLPQLTAQSLDATVRIRDFKATGTKGLLECRIRSIILPLLADHTLREANHFIRLLSSCGR
ncbi:MAG: DUF2935 domain-containing protein [Bacillota bacterium]